MALKNLGTLGRNNFGEKPKGKVWKEQMTSELIHKRMTHEVTPVTLARRDWLLFFTKTLKLL